MFKNRKEAGEILGKKVKEVFDGQLENPIVLGIPRGGVIVAKPVASAINGELQIIVARKIGFPHNPECAIGAVSEEGDVILDQRFVGIVPESFLKEEIEKELKEAKRRRLLYANGKFPEIEGRDVIIVDDGIATGATVESAILLVKRKNPKRIILAVPVIPKDKVEKFSKLVDHLVAVEVPETFWAVGQFYEDFSQTTDEEVIESLESMREKD